MKKGTVDLLEGATDLREGMVEFRDNTLDIDEQVDGEIDEMTGNVELVQFALKTKGITMPEPPKEETEAAPLSLWEKIRNLFR